MAKYLNPFTDIGFKRIFGQEFSKPLLIDFLNNLLEGEKKIVELKFLDKEQPAVYEGDRSLIYDIYCTTDKGENIIVEMQNREQPFFKKRSIYYIAESIARQGEKGPEWRYSIKAVYLVAFLNFSLEDIGEKFRTDVALMDMQSKELFSQDMRLIYLQLPHFKKGAEECENDFERWIYVLKNMETFNRLPWAAQNQVFQRLAEIADLGALTKEERMKYDEGLRKYRDTLCVMEGAVMKGRAEGRAEGKAEGTELEKQATIQRLLAAEIDLSTIAIATGMTLQEVEEAAARLLEK